MTFADLRAFQTIAGVSESTGEPFILTRAEGDTVTLVGQLAPDEVRRLALTMLEAAEAAVHDAALLRFLTSNGSTLEAAAHLIGALREYRATLDPHPDDYDPEETPE